MEIKVKGIIAKAPELRYQPDGKPVLSFSLAEGHGTKESPKATTWYEVAAWGEKAEELSKSLAKGAIVDVTGYLNCDPLDGKFKDNAREYQGKNYYGYKLTATAISLHEYKQANQPELP